MPTGVFPTLGFFGRNKSEGVSRFTRVLENGDYRTVLKSATVKGKTTIPIREVSAEERDDIHEFFLAHVGVAPIAGFEFYVYDDWYTNTVDLTGVSTTGRRIGIFLDEELSWDTVAGCRYSTNINVLLKPAG